LPRIARSSEREKQRGLGGQSDCRNLAPNMTGDGNVDIRCKGLQNRVSPFAKVILPREVTHRSERKRTRECRRAYRFQHQPILLLLVTKRVGKLTVSSGIADGALLVCSSGRSAGLSSTLIASLAARSALSLISTSTTAAPALAGDKGDLILKIINRIHSLVSSSCRCQRSMTAMCPSSWRSPAAVARLFSRSICPALSSTRSAAVFSSTRATRLVPGIGAMSSPCASTVDGADRLGVAALCDVVVAGHGHGAESNPGDGEFADRDVFHGV
jgi:hypothetical protein